jgi:GTP-binding protein
VEKELIKRASAKFVMGINSAEEMENFWANNPNAVGLAMVGRSNVGKSTLINTLFGNKTAKTSKTPGRTQQINIFKFELHGDENQYFLYDLPGYGHAEVDKTMKKNWETLMAKFFLKINHHTVLLNLQDARHPNQASDQKFYEYINPKSYSIFLIFNKMDKLKTQKERAVLDKLKPTIYSEFKAVKQIFFVSSEKKQGIAPLELSIVNYLHSRNDVLNSLENATE